MNPVLEQIDLITLTRYENRLIKEELLVDR